MAQRHALPADLPSEFDDTDPGQVTFWLGVAKIWIGLDAWGTKASEAHTLLASHFLKEAGEGASGSTQGGPVTSRKAGSVSETYAATAPTDAELGSTTYGRTFKMLRRACRLGPRAIRHTGLLVVPH
jgi:hypothetical protein